MDIVSHWDWRAWTIVVVLALVIGRALWRFSSAIAFRWLLLPRMLGQYGWTDNGDKSRLGRAEFRRWNRERRRRGWALLRKGIRGIREGYRSGVFATQFSAPPQAVVDIAGTYRGYQFLAQQQRRRELYTGPSGGSRRRVRHWSTLEVHVSQPLASGTISVTLLTGRLRVSGISPKPTLERFVRRHRLSARVYHVSPSAISAHLPGRLSRGRLLNGLDLLIELADKLQSSPHRVGAD